MSCCHSLSHLYYKCDAPFYLGIPSSIMHWVWLSEKQLRAAVPRAPHHLQFKFNLAKFLIDDKVNVDEGIKIVILLLEKFPDHWNLLNYKGWGLYKLGEFKEAVELLRLAWEKKPIYNHYLYLHLLEAEKAVLSLN